MNLDSLWVAIEGWGLSTAIRETSVLFPLIESVHVVSLTFVLGSIATVDLRLLNVVGKGYRVTALAGDLLPWTWGAFALAAVSGVTLFASSATTYAVNPAFQIKLALLIAAAANMAVFHQITWRGIDRWDIGSAPPMGAKIAGGMSLVIWIAVVGVGRWIGFL